MTPARSCCFPGAKSHRRTDDRASLSLRLCGLQHLPSAKANITGTRRRHLHPCCLRQAKSHRHTADPAHSRCFPGPKSHQHTNDRARALLSLRLCGPNPTGTTGTRMTPARSRCFPGSKSHRHSDDRALLSPRLCEPNPTGTRPPAPPVASALVASAEANPTGTRRRHLNPCRLRQGKSHQHMDDPSSFLLISRSQIPPAHGRPRLAIAAPNPTDARTTAPRYRCASAASSTSPPQKQISPAHAAVTSILAASAKPNPTGTRLTPAHSRCFPAKLRHT